MDDNDVVVKVLLTGVIWDEHRSRMYMSSQSNSSKQSCWSLRFRRQMDPTTVDGQKEASICLTQMRAVIVYCYVELISIFTWDIKILWIQNPDAVRALFLLLFKFFFNYNDWRINRWVFTVWPSHSKQYGNK